MLKDIDLIVGLQSLDKDIFDLEKEVKNIPSLLKRFNDEFSVFENNFSNLKNSFLEKTKNKKDFEMELSNIEKNIEKFNLELSSVKTNDRYKAILELIKNNKIQKDKTEEKIIILLEEIDKANEEIVKSRDSLDLKKKELEKKKIEMKKLESDLNLKISSLLKSRQKLISDINNSVFIDLYETVRKYDHNGIGIVKVNIEDSICPSCNLKIPIQKINEILNSSEPICCDNCSKIFYIV